MNHCCFFRNRPKIVVRRTAAIGDSLAASVVCEKLANQGFAVTYQTHPNNFCLLRRHRAIAQLEVPAGKTNVDLDGCYEKDPARRHRHFSEMFISTANQQLQSQGINLGPALNCRPRVLVSRIEREATLAKFQQYDRPWVFIVPRSDSYNVREVPNHLWTAAALMMEGTKFWLGTKQAPPGYVDLQARHLDNVILWLSVADVLVSVDTGPLHIGAALGVPIVALGQSSSPELHLSDQADFTTIWPPGLDCLNCQKNLCPVARYLPPCQQFQPERIAAAANAKWKSKSGNTVTAVVAVYQPDTMVLNRCLDHVLPQVDEVIVCRDQAGRFPDNAGQHEKIKYIVKEQRDIGYGRKANFAARHASGRFLLFLNDDVDLGAEAVPRMMECMKPDVAVVGQLLRYPSGTLQHAGKVRSQDGIGYHHLDHNKYIGSITEPIEVENVCGASMLIRREAFYHINGFPEDVYLYTEDDEINLAARMKGWKVMYTPHATGVHHEHLSTQKTPNIIKIMNESNARFGAKWAWYFEKNKGNHGLGTF